MGAHQVGHIYKSPPSVWHVACVVAENGVHHCRYKLICHLVEVGSNRRVGGHACHVCLNQLQRSLQQDGTIPAVIRATHLKKESRGRPACLVPAIAFSNVRSTRQAEQLRWGQ